MGHHRKAAFFLLLAVVCCAEWGFTRDASAQLVNPLRREEMESKGSAAAAVRFPFGPHQRPALLERNNSDPGITSVVSVGTEEADATPLLAPPVGEAPSFEPQPNFEQEAPLAWPGEDADFDPGEPGPVRRRIAEFRRMMRLWTGYGADRSERYLGLGEPLTGTSWLNRPWYLGAFIGTQSHDHLLAERLAQANSAVGGLRLGLDFDYYWGLELRYAYSNPSIYIPGTPTDLGSAHNYYVDMAFMYYPWGDSRWRPYFSAGIGAATYRFSNSTLQVSDSAVHVPLGLGLKYYYAPWLTFRFDAEYAMSLGNGNTDFQNEFMLGLGVEFRFGGRRTNYYPWVGDAAYW